MDYTVDDFGRKTPVYKLAPPVNAFSYPLDLLSAAAEIYMDLGETDVPSIKEVLYGDLSWDNQVRLYAEGLKWARDLDKQ